MTKQELRAYIDREINLADAGVSVLVKDLARGEAVINIHASRCVTAASTIKTPVMMAVLHLVKEGILRLDDSIPVKRADILEDSVAFERGECRCSIRELLTWMMIMSDNTAANVLIRLVTEKRVNAFCASLGLKDTVLRRAMLDREAAARGMENTTSALDQLTLFEGLYRKTVLTPALCETALSILRRQRWNDQALRYIADDVMAAHKTGNLPGICHDAGILYLPGAAYYFGFFVTDEEHGGGKPLIGRMSRAVYDYMKTRAR